ncbi:MAG: PAS domain S-box protein, partial [Bacteroidetes bacterium]|nr:PAS domain S-box protein [Bacteroidota bacterium]
KILSGSAEAKRLFGFGDNSDFFTIEAIEACIPDRERVHQALLDLILDNKSYNLEYLINPADGSIPRVIFSKAQLEKDAKGNPVSVIGVIQDITERKKAETELINKTTILSNLIINLQEGILLEDSNRKIVLTNQLFCYMFGIPVAVQSLIGADCSDSAEQSKHLFKDPDKFIADINVILSEKKAAFNNQLELHDGRHFERDYIPIYIDENYSGHLWKYRDVTERNHAEQILNARLRLSEFSHSHSRNELQQKLLDELELLTNSSIGFFHSVDANQSALTLQSWSTNTLQNMCNAEGHSRHYNIENSGVWVDCFRQRKTIIHNDYMSLPNRRGLPEGHAPVIRELVTPIFRNDQIVAIVGIGNKPTDYLKSDIDIVSLLADMAWDITERKGAEEAVHDSEALYRSILHASPDNITITDMEGRFLIVSPAALVMFGFERAEQLLNRTFNEFLIPEDREKAKSRILLLYQGIVTKAGEYKALKADGTIFDIEVNGEFIRNVDGKPTRMVFIIRDITERKKIEKEIRDFYGTLEVKIEERTAQLTEINKSLQKEIEERKLTEDALLESKNRFSLFMDYLPAIVFLKDHEGRTLFVNKYMDDAFGASRWLGKTMTEVFPNEFGQKLKTDDLNAMNSGYQKIEETIKNLDGKLHNYETQKFIIHRPGQEPLLGGISLDITERKLAEKEIIKARNEAEQANHAKSEFLSRMSHELRTPMNSILGFAQLMNMGDLSQTHKKGVNHILNSGKHLLNLINEVLDISGIESGRVALSLEPIQLNNIIIEMLDAVQPNAEKRNLKTGLEYSTSNRLFVFADRQRLKQVLLNLIGNAVKYNSEGGSIIIKTELKNPDASGISMVRISICDTGSGIRDENLNRLFQPFERLGADKTETEGTGLGLMVVKKLMTAMGGVVGVQSITGAGTTFWIELPLTEVQNNQNERNTRASILKIPKTGTIIYIEDNASNIELVEEILSTERPGIRLITNIYGGEVVQLAIEYTPDLILLDLDLPDIPGTEVLRLLQAEEKSKTIPVVVISADAMPDQFEKLMNAGAVNYLTKPIDVVMFLRVVDEWVGIGNKKQF